VYLGNPSSPHPCRPSAQRRRQSIAGGGRSPGSLADSARRVHRGEVRLPSIMHTKVNLLDDVGDVRAGECQVLEGPSEAHELSRISNRSPRSGRDLGMRVHGRRDRLAVHHADALKDVESELVLSEEEAICLMLYRNPQKMMKRARSFMANSGFRADMVCCRSDVLDAVSTMLST
jgi:hypothetical protein